MIVKILGTNEVVDIPDEPHPIELEIEAFDRLVRRPLQAAAVSVAAVDGAEPR